MAEGGLPWRYDAEGNVIVSSPPKETRDFDGRRGAREFVLEEAIIADFGLVRAWKGDRHGNLVYRDSARNFNPLAAMCGRVTIAEVEELVEPGELDPNDVHTPGVFVQRVVALTPEQAADKRIEKRTVRPKAAGGGLHGAGRGGDGRAGGLGADRRVVREPRDRAADAGAELCRRRRRAGAAVGERDPGGGCLPVSRARRTRT